VVADGVGAGGLDDTVNEAVLHAAFIPFGDIKDVNIPLDQTTQKNRGFGFITYVEKVDAGAAMDNMHNSELYGRVRNPTHSRRSSTTNGRSLLCALPALEGWIVQSRLHVQESSQATRCRCEQGSSRATVTLRVASVRRHEWYEWAVTGLAEAEAGEGGDGSDPIS
jgi:RNA recognition motif-containing protein